MAHTVPFRVADAQLTTVVDFPERGEGGDPRYRGNWGASFVEVVLRWIATQTNVRRVNEVFTGSGTTIDVGERLGIDVDGRDLNPNPRRGIGGWDAQSDYFDSGCDALLLHPPYWQMIPYSGAVWGKQPDARDLSQIPTWDDFVKAMNQILIRHYPTVKVGGYIAVLVGDVVRNGSLYSMQHDIAWLGSKIRMVIKVQRHYTSERATYTAKRAFIPVEHEYLLLFRRDDAYLQPVSFTVRRVIDMRQREAQTWRDVVYAALEARGGESDLQGLYQEIDGHAKTRANRFWKEQIRMVLQTHADFRHIARGQWGIAA